MELLIGTGFINLRHRGQVRIWFEELIMLLLGMCCLCGCSAHVWLSHEVLKQCIWNNVIRAWPKFSKGTQVHCSQMLKLLYITFANKITACLSTWLLWKLSWWWCPALSLFLLSCCLNGCSIGLLGSQIIFVLYFKASCISSVLHVSQCEDTVKPCVNSTWVSVG